MITPNVSTVKPLGFGAVAMGSWRNTWATAALRIPETMRTLPALWLFRKRSRFRETSAGDLVRSQLPDEGRSLSTERSPARSVSQVLGWAPTA